MTHGIPTRDGCPAHPACVSIDAIEGPQAFDVLRSEWENLWRSSVEATETQSWHWQYLYWKHCAFRSRPLIITARNQEGSCAALAAFAICRDRLSWLSKAAFLGDKRPDYHLILAKPSLSHAYGRRILEYCLTRFAKRVSFIEFSNIPQNSYTGRIVEELFGSGPGAGRSGITCWEWPTYAVPLPSTVDEYLRQLGPRSRRDFHHDRKKLRAEFAVTFRVYSTLDEVDAALDAIETIDRARWGSNSRYGIKSERSFERAIARALCGIGIYRAFVLYLDGRPCAFVTGAVVRTSFKVASIGFDRSIPGRLSVGKVANFYAIEHCIEHGYKEFDLTRGGEEYKKWLGAVPSTNLHVRRYRSRLDEALDRSGKRIVGALRNQSWLRRAYQMGFRR